LRIKNFYCNGAYKSYDDFEIAIQLFQEYAESVGFSLLFHNFGQELKISSLQNVVPKLCMLLARYKSVSVCHATLRPVRY